MFKVNKIVRLLCELKNLIKIMQHTVCTVLYEDFLCAGVIIKRLSDSNIILLCLAYEYDHKNIFVNLRLLNECCLKNFFFIKSKFNLPQYDHYA